MARSQKNYIGIDIGGTKIEGIFWGRGKILRVEQVRTPKNRQKFLRALIKLIQQLVGGQKFSGIGIGSAGGIDVKRSRISYGPNTKLLSKLPLVKILKKTFRKPVKLDNDTSCFLLGEYFFGQGKGKKNLVGLTLGTGTGGAVMLNGRIMHGSHISAYELGHMIITREKNEFLSMEDLVSSHGFKRFSKWGALETQKKALGGSREARKVYETIGGFLGIGLANLVNIFDPEIILIGGGISRSGSLLLRPAKREMKKHTLRSIKRLPPVKVSRLKHAGALGAVCLFLNKN